MEGERNAQKVKGSCVWESAEECELSRVRRQWDSVEPQHPKGYFISGHHVVHCEREIHV